VKRPSFATVVALLALFVALGGPAEAERLLGKGSVTSREIRNRSIKLNDLHRKAVRRLQSTRNNSITAAKLANGSVTQGKLARGAVGTAAIADRSIVGTDLANGSLTAQQLGRFWGRFQIRIPEPIGPDECWSGEPAGLAPELARVDISEDLVLVTPDERWPEDRLAFTVRNSANPMRFVLAGCNRSEAATVQPFDVGFRYLIIDLP
jgi:hypothetical protein